MKAIALDFCRRWWWVLVIALLVAAISPFSGTPIVLAPVIPVLLLFDAQRGAMRPWRLLPLTLKDLALVIWLLSIVLIPLLSLLLMVPGGLYRTLTTADGHLIWFRMIVQVYVGIGYAAVMLLPAAFLTSRPPERWYEHIVQMTMGLIWGFSIAGLVLVLPNLPKSPWTIETWHWVVFAIVPVAVGGSYVFSTELIRRRAGHRPVKSTSPESARSQSTGAQGVTAFLLNLPVRAVVMTLFIFFSQQLFFALMFNDAKVSPGRFASMQCALFGMMIAALMTENAGLRGLRALPLRASRLALLLCTPTLAVAVAVTIIAMWESPLNRGNSAVSHSPLTIGAAVAGVGLLCVAAALYLPRGGKILLIFLVALLTPGFTMLPPSPWMGVVGVLVGILGYWLILRGIKVSPAFYQTRRMFGLGVDQPQC